jgi:uncharacterized protein (TIGR02265 family)
MEPVVFSHSVEGLVRAMGPALDVAAKSRLRALGLDLERPLAPAYPLPVWVEVMRFAAALVAPGKNEPDQMTELGRRFIDGYEQTLVGKAMLATLRLLGPRRTLERMSRNFRSGNNYTEAKLVAHAPTDVELWLSRVKEPAFYAGMLQAALARTGARELNVSVVGRDELGATFRLTWVS